MNETKPVSGWGRYPRTEARVSMPTDLDELRKLLDGGLRGACIARGSGLSYGDSALAPEIISSRDLGHRCELDRTSGVLRCSAGLRLREVLREVVPQGWFLPVLPGTGEVSVGGAVAADVHGKNHHRDGSFCEHARELTLVLASGEVVRCGPGRERSSAQAESAASGKAAGQTLSPGGEASSCGDSENASSQNSRQASGANGDFGADLFRATCGGMGLTGIVLEAELQLAPITSARMASESLPAANLAQCFELLEEHEQSHYSVAWLDCLARGPRMGRGTVYLAEHEAHGELRYRQRRSVAVPFATPASLLNRPGLALFNATYFHWQKLRTGRSSQGIDSYFFPLDGIGNWNLLYGGAGFLQYQFVLPDAAARQGIAEVLRRASAAGKGSFLSVLKKMGPANGNLLSFPTSGYTLALDFKREASLFPLLEELDSIVLDHGGCIYLAKDARMSETVFQQSYPDWQRFLAIKQAVDPAMRFRSAQSERLGLTGAKP